MKDLSTKQNYYLTLWLRVMCAAIICMIFIGGLTRLTDSGLSITEWKPVTGILPPLTEASWISEFESAALCDAPVLPSQRAVRRSLPA